MVKAAVGKNGSGDGSRNSAQVGQEKSLAALAEIAIVIRGIRMGGTQVRMGMRREQVVLMCALVIRAGGRLFLQRMGHTLGTRVKFGKGAARANRGEEQQQYAERDGDRSRYTPKPAQGLQNTMCAVVPR